MIDLTRVTWRKSSRSGGNNGQCVELACAPGLRAVRDSKNIGPALVFHQRAAAAFLAAVKSGRVGH